MPGLYRTKRRSSGPTLGGSELIQVTGADRLADVTKALRQVGNKDLRNKMTRTLRANARPLIQDARRNARRILPEEGGVNEVVARSKFRVSIHGMGKRVGVRITAVGLDSRLDKTGRLRHPTFGRREKGDWKEQQVQPHWFSDPMQAGAPKVRRDMLITLGEIGKELEQA